MKKILFILAVAVAFTGCKSDDNSGTPQGVFGDLNLQFENRVGAQPLSLNTVTYTNGSAETYEVSELKYIISNIVLIDASGNEFVYPQAESYFVINEAVSASKSLALTNIPAGTYASVRFGFGVDQSNYPLNGVNNFIPTAEENGMLWSWSAGYKFLKFEGTFDSATQTDAPFLLHIGSHGTTQDNYKEITIPLASAVTISDNETLPFRTIKMDVAKIFDGTNTHSLEEKSDIQVDPVYAPILSENVASSFSEQQ